MEKQIIKPEDVINYKPSNFIEKAIDDLDAVTAAGYGFNMGKWIFIAGTEGPSLQCTVCLGGAVLMNRFANGSIKRHLWGRDVFLNDLVSTVTKNASENSLLYNIAHLFNAIRMGDSYDTSYYMKSIWEIPENLSEHLYEIINLRWHREPFLGSIDFERIPALKEQILKLVSILRELDL